jgi:hypothetical protein
MKERLIKIVSALALPTLLGLSCSHSDEIKVNTTETTEVEKIVKKWGLKNNLESFDCHEYWTTDTLPASCIRSINSENKVPPFVVHVSSLQQETFVIVYVTENQSNTEVRKELLFSLKADLGLAFGEDNVEMLK